MFKDDNKSPILKPIFGAVDGIGASKTAVVDLPTQATYLDLSLECRIGGGAGALATRANFQSFFTGIRCTLDGREQWNLTATQLIALVEFYRTGLIGDTGFLAIPLQRLWMNDYAAQEGPAWGTLGRSSFQLEITQSAGTTIDYIQPWARLGTVAEELGAYIRPLRFTPTINSAGQFTYQNLRKVKGEFLYALHFQIPTVADLTNIQVLCDEIQIANVNQGILARYYTESNPNRTPQTANGFVHLDFCSRNIDEDAVPMTMDQIIVLLTFANAPVGQVNIIGEYGVRAPAVGTVQGQ